MLIELLIGHIHRGQVIRLFLLIITFYCIVRILRLPIDMGREVLIFLAEIKLILAGAFIIPLVRGAHRQCSRIFIASQDSTGGGSTWDLWVGCLGAMVTLNVVG